MLSCRSGPSSDGPQFDDLLTYGHQCYTAGLLSLTGIRIFSIQRSQTDDREGFQRCKCTFNSGPSDDGQLWVYLKLPSIWRSGTDNHGGLTLYLQFWTVGWELCWARVGFKVWCSFGSVSRFYQCWAGIKNTHMHHSGITRASQSHPFKVSSWMIPWLKIKISVLTCVRTSFKKIEQTNLRTG